MKVLIIGLGSIARKHIDALHTLEADCIIHALRSSQNNKSIDGITDIYQLPAHPDYDFVIISNTTSCHASTIKRIAKTGIPMFIEKPVFEKLGYSGLVKEIQESGTITYVACNLRFLGCIEFIHNYIASHPNIRINEVNAYCGSYLPDWRPGKDYKECYSAIPELGGGVHIDLIHELDYIYWIFGKPINTTGTVRNVSSLGICSFDYANYIFFYPEFSASIILNYYRRDYKRTLEIVFEDKTWIADISMNRILDSAGNIVYQGEDRISGTYTTQMQHFLTLLSNGKKAENDIEEAYNVLKISLSYERFEK